MDNFNHNVMCLDMAHYWVATCQQFLDMLIGYETVPEEWKEEEIYPDIMDRLVRAQELLEKVRFDSV